MNYSTITHNGDTYQLDKIYYSPRSMELVELYNYDPRRKKFLVRFLRNGLNTTCNELRVTCGIDSNIGTIVEGVKPPITVGPFKGVLMAFPQSTPFHHNEVFFRCESLEELDQVIGDQFSQSVEIVFNHKSVDRVQDAFVRFSGSTYQYQCNVTFVKIII